MHQPTIILLWDIDGTLLLTGGAGERALNSAFHDLYGEDDVFKGIDPHGRTDISLIKECYERRLGRTPEPHEVEQIKIKYCTHIEHTLQDAPRFRLMPHVKETLKSLSEDKNIAMGLATGNFRQSGFSKLKRGGLDHYFFFGGYGCDFEDRYQLTRKAYTEARRFSKKNPDQVYLIGDTIHDIRCGKAVGIKTIGVCTNNTAAETLHSEGADWVMPDVGQMRDFLHQHRADVHELPE